MFSSTSKSNKQVALTRVQALIAGTQKHFPNASFTLGNATYTTATLIQVFRTLEGALAALAAAHVQVKDAGTTVTSTEAKAAPVIRDFRRFVLASFSTSPQVLADFGIQPPKARKPMTSEKRAVAAAKMRATRKARGTASKKQKLAVRGDVTSVKITPVVAPAASSVTAAPADATLAAHAPSVAAPK